jgi:hypothetical protein
MKAAKILQSMTLTIFFAAGLTTTNEAEAAKPTAAAKKPNTSITFECVPAESEGNYWCCITFDDGKIVCTSGSLT